MLYTLPVGVAGSEPLAVTAVAFSPDNTLIAAAVEDGTVQLWSILAGEQLAILAGHAAPIADLAFSPDGSLLASAGEDSQVLLWDVAEGALFDSISTSLIGRALAVTFSPDGNQIAVGGHKCAVALYSTWTSSSSHNNTSISCEDIYMRSLCCSGLCGRVCIHIFQRCILCNIPYGDLFFHSILF